MPFLEPHAPSLESQWRAAILFGRNVASYKFALGRALLELAGEGREFVPLADLARPFARHLVGHLKAEDKQGTNAGSRYLNDCRRFNAGEIDEDALYASTARLGFVNVIDAFHVVGSGALPARFYTDERRGGAPGVRLTQDLFTLAAAYQAQNLPGEIESRWRLVETAWALGISRDLLQVHFDPATLSLVVDRAQGRRVTVTSCRGALDGYQKGKCFYCFADVSIVEGSPDLADVDHVFPHVLQARGIRRDLNAIWNLVLACAACNRGADGKFASAPSDPYVERLHRRNEFLIGSHHPLRETLLTLTGETEPVRRAFLDSARRGAVDHLIHRWSARDELAPCF